MEAKSNETQLLSNAERQARFKANKAFKSLPLDVQRSIERISDSPEEKARRTQAALDYQKKFPDNRGDVVLAQAGIQTTGAGEPPMKGWKDEPCV